MHDNLLYTALTKIIVPHGRVHIHSKRTMLTNKVLHSSVLFFSENIREIHVNRLDYTWGHSIRNFEAFVATGKICLNVIGTIGKLGLLMVKLRSE